MTYVAHVSPAEFQELSEAALEVGAAEQATFASPGRGIQRALAVLRIVALEGRIDGYRRGILDLVGTPLAPEIMVVVDRPDYRPPSLSAPAS